MSRIDRVTPRTVEAIPAQLEDGVVYISKKYNTAAHLCCCGCGNRVATPTTTTGWRLTLDEDRVTLSPSIGNGSFPCRSHYWICDGKVRWLPTIEPWQTDRDRAHDRAEAESAIAPASLLQRLIRWIRKLFGR